MAVDMGNVIKPGRAHFPEALETKIMPPPGVVAEVQQAVGMSHDTIRRLVDQAVDEGFGRGAIVCAPRPHYISADVWNWGMVIGLNYGTPVSGKPWEGALTVMWPMKSPSERETKCHPDQVFLVMPAPHKDDVEEWTKEMKAQFAVGRRT